MILYLGHQTEGGLKLEFVFSIGNLNNESANIPRIELDIMERGVKQCEKIMDWMATRVEKKILISDAKVPLSWVRNPNLRTQPYVQTRVHNICKIFNVAEAFYMKSGANPSDLGTKFDKFNDVHLLLGEDSRFRNGPACLKKGIKAAVAAGELVPLNQITQLLKKRRWQPLKLLRSINW